MSATATTVPSRSVFVRHRLGSLLAVAPLSVWVANHLWNNLSAFFGAKAWETAVTGDSHPATQLVTFVVVVLPLVLHTVWGIRRLRTTKPNYGSYSYFANLKYLLQRLSAVGLMLFLGAHMWLAWLHPRYVEGHPESFAAIAGEMHNNPPTLIVYLLGTAGAAYHIANGLQGFAMGWGVVSSRMGMKRMEQAVLVIFAVLLAMGWGSVFALWQAGA